MARFLSIHNSKWQCIYLADKHGISLKIMRILLNEGGDISTREIARRLRLPSSNVHYHLMRLVNRGVLIKEVIEGSTLQAYYTPQPIFTENIEETLKLLNRLAKKIEGDELANCIDMFQQCYDPG